MKKNREKLFSVSADDCTWQEKRGSGTGGQKKNKTSSAIQVSHLPSGATGESEAGRSQLQNRKDAWLKMVNSPLFQSWLKLKIDAANDKVDIEEYDDSGKLVKRKLRMDEV